MQVKQGERILADVPAAAEPADDAVWRDYYTRLPQIRLSGDATGDRLPPGSAMDVMLDGNDVARLVECAVRHPSLNMRYAVLAAIWNHPDAFRQIFRFGLEAPEGFPEIRKLVIEELEKCSAKPAATALDQDQAAGGPLLPQMPLPAHLRDRQRR